MKKRVWLFGLMISLAVALAGAPASFGAPVKPEFKLKYAHVQPEKHITNLSALWMAEQLKARSNGRIELAVYPGGVLGRPNEMLDSLQIGDLDLAWISSANLGPSIKEFNVFSLSYLFKDYKHFAKVMNENTSVMKTITEATEKSQYGVKVIGILGGVSRQLYNGKKPVQARNDLSGMKVRVQQSAVESKIWASLGAVPQQLAWTEIYTGLQTGVIDAAESSMDAYFQNKFYEVAPHFAFTNHQFMVLPLLLSNKTYSKLPQDLRSLILKVAAESADYCQKLYLESEEKLVKEAPEKGIKITYPDTAAFQSKVAPIIEEEAAKYKVVDIVKAIGEVAK